MTAPKRIEITVETDRTVIIRRRRSIRAWCPECGCEVDMVGREQVEVLTGMSGRVLRDSALAQGWHVAENQDGTLLICLESLLKAT